MSSIAVIAFTLRGCSQAKKIAAGLASQGCVVSVSAPARIAQDAGVSCADSLGAWAAAHFGLDDSLVFVGAAGIAVRAIAPYVKDKFQDPAVVVVDEAGRFAVSLLSGHVGGANRLARRVAELTGGQAVIGTATDVNDVWAVDVWASDLGMAIMERNLAKEVSATLLEGGTVGFVSDFPVEGDLPSGLVEQLPGCDAGKPQLGIHVTWDISSKPFERTLHLVPRCVVLGMGCRKEAAFENVSAMAESILREAHVPDEAVSVLASIDVKSEEPAFKQLAQQNHWRLRFLSAEQLMDVPGKFPASVFVLKTVGVSNVSMRAAVWPRNAILIDRRANNGVTASLAVGDFQVRF